MENGDLDDHLDAISSRLHASIFDHRLKEELKENPSPVDEFMAGLSYWQDPFTLTPSTVWTAVGGAVPAHIANLVGTEVHRVRESTTSTGPMKSQIDKNHPTIKKNRERDTENTSKFYFA